MPETRVINLTIDNGVVKFKNDAGQWQAVDADNPTTALGDGDSIDWSGDATIKKIKIRPKNGSIFNVQDDDTQKPKGKVKTGLGGRPLTEKYTIHAKPTSGGGGYIEVDPKVTYPAG